MNIMNYEYKKIPRELLKCKNCGIKMEWDATSCLGQSQGYFLCPKCECCNFSLRPHPQIGFFIVKMICTIGVTLAEDIGLYKILYHPPLKYQNKYKRKEIYTYFFSPSSEVDRVDFYAQREKKALKYLLENTENWNDKKEKRLIVEKIQKDYFVDKDKIYYYAEELKPPRYKENYLKRATRQLINSNGGQ